MSNFLKMLFSRGAWLAQSVKCPSSAQEPGARFWFCLPLSESLPWLHSVSFSPSKHEHTLKKLNIIFKSLHLAQSLPPFFFPQALHLTQVCLNADQSETRYLKKKNPTNSFMMSTFGNLTEHQRQNKWVHIFEQMDELQQTCFLFPGEYRKIDWITDII